MSWRRSGDGDRQTGRFSGCVGGDRSKFGSYAGSIFQGEISLSLQKVDVCPSLGDNVGGEG